MLELKVDIEFKNELALNAQGGRHKLPLSCCCLRERPKRRYYLSDLSGLIASCL